MTRKLSQQKQEFQNMIMNLLARMNESLLLLTYQILAVHFCKSNQGKIVAALHNISIYWYSNSMGL